MDAGAHTIGRAHCESVRFGCAKGATFDLDSTPQEFDSDYYNKLVNGQGMMHSDQVTIPPFKLLWRIKSFHFDHVNAEQK